MCMKQLLTIFFLVSTAVQAQQDMSFSKRIDRDSVYIDLINNLYAPAEIILTIQDSVADNIVLKERFIIASRDTVTDILKIPVNIVKDTSAVPLSHYFTFGGKIGDPNTAKHDKDYRYSLPFSKGRKFKVIQGFGGSFSHDSKRSYYAVDFNTQVGDTICAAREGIVVRIRDSYTERGGRKFIDKANMITVLHNDGTLASYVHLDYKGVFVQPGDRLERGQPIGISGYTGFTTTPHLHFVVREARDVSVPIVFEGYEEQGIRKGKKYKRKK